MGSMENKKFDIILSNPPYGQIGVEVTWRIISEIEFEDFVNLLPANDYFKRENSKKYKLWQYVKNVKRMIPLKHEFEDAAVTTHMCKIQKSPNLFISAEEFLYSPTPSKTELKPIPPTNKSLLFFLISFASVEK